MKIIPLGTNGFFPSFGRQTACFAIRLKKRLIILDAGSGLFRLAEPIGKELFKEVKEVDLFLSHYHLDHTLGFYAAFKLLENKKVNAYAASSRKIFFELVKLNYFPVEYDKKHANFSWQKLTIGENEMEDYKVQVRKQFHRGEGSLAFRFDFGLAYVTDSEPTKEGVDFVREVPLLLHEHGVVGDKNSSFVAQFKEGHVTTIGAALIARNANVGKLALIHHNPFSSNVVLGSQLIKVKKIFPASDLAIDLKKIDF